MPSGVVTGLWSRVSMSLTLHTTEIWLNTDTDSGGMKDRTHGIFLLKVSEIKGTNLHCTLQKNNTASYKFKLWYISLINHSFPKCNKCIFVGTLRLNIIWRKALSFTFSVKLQSGGRPWHLVQSKRLGLYDLWGSLRGWGGGMSAAGIGCRPLPFSWV